MALWCDKYGPNCFDDFQFHKNEAERLKKLISNDNFPHLLIYGVRGSGKRTLVRALLIELFGPNAAKLKMEVKVFETNSGKKIMQNMLSSAFHIELNPSENGFYDRIVIQELLRDVGTTQPISKKHFRVVVINEADRLTREAQQSLRRTLEKYVSTCRVILISECSSRIIPALKSRCLMLRNEAPSHEQIVSTMEKIMLEEKLSLNDQSILEQISHNCEQNVRRAILLLQGYFFKISQQNECKLQLNQFKWEAKIEDLAKILTTSQSVRQVAEIRAMLYDLQIHLIPNEIILRTLFKKLWEYCLDNDMKLNLISILAEVNHRMVLGTKPIIHLELFCVKFMLLFLCTVEKVAFDLEQPLDF